MTLGASKPLGPEVFVANEQDEVEVDLLRWKELAQGVLRLEGIVGAGELSLIFVDAESMAALNERFMGKKGPTDVLSFPISEVEEESGRIPDNGGNGPHSGSPRPPRLPYLLGDVVIAPTQALANAQDHKGDRGHTGTLEDEIALLVVHGILHLRGMDHEEDEEAEVMEAREDQILGELYFKVDLDGSSAG